MPSPEHPYIGGYFDLDLAWVSLWFGSQSVSPKRIKFDADSPIRSNSASDGIFIRDKCERVDACADFADGGLVVKPAEGSCVLIRFRQTENRCRYNQM